MDRPLEEPARTSAGTTRSTTRSSSAPRWVDSVREIDAAWVLQTLKRRKWFVVLPTLAATVLAAFLLLLVASRYSATTEVMIDTAQQQVVNIQAVLTDALPDQEAVDSQVEVLRSRGVAEKVIAALGLDGDPEFNELLKPEGVLESFAQVDPRVDQLAEGRRLRRRAAAAARGHPPGPRAVQHHRCLPEEPRRPAEGAIAGTPRHLRLGRSGQGLADRQ